MLTRHDVGHRVTIRRTVPAPVDQATGTGSAHGPSPGSAASGTRPRYADVVGDLVEVTDAELLLRTSRGLVTIPCTAVKAAKRIPDRRPLTASERLQRIASDGWPAPEQEQLGDWLLRAAGGWTARANSALPVGRSGLTLPDSVDAVAAWYRERGLPPAIMVPEPVGGRLTAELRSRGWHDAPPSLVQTASTAVTTPDPGMTAASAGGSRPASSGTTTTAEVRLDPAPSPHWLELVAGYKNGLGDPALRILTGVARARFATALTPDGSPLGAARGVIGPDGEWLGISLVTVLPAARRQGLATVMTAALMRWAADEGAHRAYLQVLEDNEPAIRLYAGMGFTTHHRYTTWSTG